MDTRELDEINIYNNGNGHYTIEMHYSNPTHTMTLTMPEAVVSMSLTASIWGENEIQITAIGDLASK